MDDWDSENLITSLGKFLGVITAFIAIVVFIFSESQRIQTHNKEEVTAWQKVTVNAIIECAGEKQIQFDQIMCEFKAHALCDVIQLSIEDFDGDSLRNILLQLQSSGLVEYNGNGFYASHLGAQASEMDKRFSTRCNELRERELNKITDQLCIQALTNLRAGCE